jgi:hypothetical protein
MSRCGVARKALAKAFAGALAAAPTVKAGRRIEGLRELTEAAHVVTLWCSSPDYVDERGVPKRLPARGRRRSVESLARRACPHLHLDDVLKYLTKTQTVRKVGRAYRLNRRWVNVRGLEGYAHTRSVRALVNHLRTLEHNLCSPTDADSWFEFAVDNLEFPVSHLPAFDRRLRREGLGWLRKADLFMQQCAAERDPAEPTVWLGVDMHLFQHSPGATRGRPDGSSSAQKPPTPRRRRSGRA